MGIRFISQFGLLFIALLVSHTASALSVGDAHLHSKLGEPLLATLNISNAERLSEQQIKIKLAPREIQQQRQVSNFHLQQGLNIHWQAQGDQFKVSIRGTDPIKEPFVHLILQVIWPEGKLFKEYKLLLDPP